MKQIGELEKTRNKVGVFLIWGLRPQTPGIYRFGTNPEVCRERPGEAKGVANHDHPASVLVPGSALGLLPSMALSSAQATWHCSLVTAHSSIVLRRRRKRCRN